MQGRGIKAADELAALTAERNLLRDGLARIRARQNEIKLEIKETVVSQPMDVRTIQEVKRSVAALTSERDRLLNALKEIQVEERERMCAANEAAAAPADLDERSSSSSDDEGGGGGGGARRRALLRSKANVASLTLTRDVLRAEVELLRYRRAEALRPFLSELSQEDLSAFVDRLMGRLQSWRRFNDIGTLLEDPRRYVEDIVFALARNRRDGRGRVEQTFLLQINGDVQRGKSTMEALHALVVKLVNDDDTVRDRCFSVLGTQLLPWAKDLTRKVVGMTTHAAAANGAPVQAATPQRASQAGGTPLATTTPEPPGTGGGGAAARSAGRSGGRPPRGRSRSRTPPPEVLARAHLSTPRTPGTTSAGAAAQQATAAGVGAGAVEEAAIEDENAELWAASDEDDDLTILMTPTTAAAAGGAVEGHEGNGGLPEGRLFRVTPITREGLRAADHEIALRETMTSGGCVVFSRSHANIDSVTDAIHRLTRAQQAAGLTVSAHFVILDEADRMRGLGKEEDSNLLYELALARLTGRLPSAPHLPPPRRSGSILRGQQHSAGGAAQAVPTEEELDRRPVHLRAAMVSDVSATNGLCFFSMLYGMADPARKVMDIVSFKSDPNYVGFDSMVEFRPEGLPAEEPAPLLSGLSEKNTFVNDQVVSVFQEVFSTPWASVLDCCASRVNTGTDCNMQVHAREVARQLEERGTLTNNTAAFLFIHGCGTTFRGLIGLQFVGQEAGARMAHLQERVGRAGGEMEPFSLNDCPGPNNSYTCASHLGPLLKELDDRSFEADPGKYHRIYRGDKIGLEQLPLMLLLLRSVWPGMPIAVIGNTMVRRSLSLVVTNTLRDVPGLPFETPLMALTHEVIWASEGSNAADLTQQFLRASTTLRDFHTRYNFQNIRVLAPGHVWATVLACVVFNAWFSARFTTGPDGARKAAGRDETMQIFDRIGAAMQRGMSVERAVHQNLDLPKGVKRLLEHRNAFHARASHLKQMGKNIIQRFRGETAGAYGAEEGFSDDDDDAGGVIDPDEEEQLGRLQGTAVRRAHKAEAMAHLRAKLLLPRERGGTGGAAHPLALVGELLADVRIQLAGVSIQAIVDDVVDHKGFEQIWRDHQVWLFRGVEGTLNCSASRDAQPTEGGGEGEGEGVADGDASGEDAEMVDALSEVERGASAGLIAAAADAAVEAAARASEAARVADEAEALTDSVKLTEWLLANGLGRLERALRGPPLNVRRVEQLALVREADLAEAGRIHLRDRQDLLDKVAETVFSPPAGCSGCGKVATLCTNDPCGHTGACGDCERAARLLRGQVCGECGLPSRLIEPATTACGICLDRFTAAEMFAVADALAPLEGAGGAGAGATAPPCPHKFCVACMVDVVRDASTDMEKIPLRCPSCRGDLYNNLGAIADLPVVQPDALRPLVTRSRLLPQLTGIIPLQVRELRRFKFRQAEVLGSGVRCPEITCQRLVLVPPLAAAAGGGLGASHEQHGYPGQRLAALDGEVLAVTCPKCTHEFCRACTLAPHAGFLCAQARRLHLETASTDAERAILRSTQLCFSCGSPGTHFRGHRCHHIRCPMPGCRADYCYVCAGPYPCEKGCPGYCARPSEGGSARGGPGGACPCPDCPICEAGQRCHDCDQDGRCQPCARRATQWGRR